MKFNKVPCAECGAPLSRFARMCPRCGYAFAWLRRRTVIRIIVVLMFAVVVGSLLLTVLVLAIHGVLPGKYARNRIPTHELRYDLWKFASERLVQRGFYEGPPHFEKTEFAGKSWAILPLKTEYESPTDPIRFGSATMYVPADLPGLELLAREVRRVKRPVKITAYAVVVEVAGNSGPPAYRIEVHDLKLGWHD